MQLGNKNVAAQLLFSSAPSVAATITYGTILKTMACPLVFMGTSFALSAVVSTIYLPYFLSGGFYCIGNILQKGSQGYRARQRAYESEEWLQDGDYIDKDRQRVAMSLVVTLIFLEALQQFLSYCTDQSFFLFYVIPYYINPYLLSLGASMSGFMIGNSVDRSLGLPILIKSIPQPSGFAYAYAVKAEVDSKSIDALRYSRGAQQESSVTYCAILKTMACPLFFTGALLIPALLAFTAIISAHDWLPLSMIGISGCIGNILQKGSQGYRARQRLFFSTDSISNELLQEGDGIDKRNRKEIAYSFFTIVCLAALINLNPFCISLAVFLTGFMVGNNMDRCLKLPLLEATSIPISNPSHPYP